jgi:protein TonB
VLAPPAALRTPVAEAPQPTTLTVAENLTAAKTSGPVVATAPAPVAAPKEEAITEANGSAAYLNNPPPAYPKAAQRQGLQGRVVLRVQVLANGHVGAIEVKQSSGKSILDDAALTAVKAWVFTPSKRGSTPIDGWTNVPIEFQIAP